MENNFICKFCGKACKNANSLRNHERLCKQNPNRQESSWTKYNKEHEVWNKGLTKDTDERVKHAGETLSANISAGISCCYDHRKTWTQERRQAQSERKKKFYSEHPEQHPNRKLAGNRGKMTYPEQLVNDWLIEHLIEFVHNYQYITDKFNRYVDFYLVKQNIFIEVDGEYWHQDKTLDEAKDLDAMQHNIKTIRIKPKHNVIEQLEQELK